MSSRRIAACLEVSPKTTFASALDWPGWCRPGRDQGAALEALASYAERCDQVSEELQGLLATKRRELAHRVSEMRFLDGRMAHLAGQLEAGSTPRTLISRGKEDQDANAL